MRGGRIQVNEAAPGGLDRHVSDDLRPCQGDGHVSRPLGNRTGHRRDGSWRQALKGIDLGGERKEIATQRNPGAWKGGEGIAQGTARPTPVARWAATSRWRRSRDIDAASRDDAEAAGFPGPVSATNPAGSGALTWRPDGSRQRRAEAYPRLRIRRHDVAFQWVATETLELRHSPVESRSREICPVAPGRGIDRGASREPSAAGRRRATPRVGKQGAARSREAVPEHHQTGVARRAGSLPGPRWPGWEDRWEQAASDTRSSV